MEGFLINIDGINNVGKTTQVKKLASIYDALVVHEPGTSPYGIALRDIVKNPEMEISPVARALAHGSSHRNNIDNLVKPALTQGKNVIRDRGPASLYAYQGGGDRVPIATILEIIKLSEDTLEDRDYTIILDGDPEELAPRAKGGLDYYEKRGLEFHRAAKDYYLAYARKLGSRAIVIDANQEVTAVTDQICEFIDSKISK